MLAANYTDFTLLTILLSSTNFTMFTIFLLGSTNIATDYALYTSILATCIS